MSCGMLTCPSPGSRVSSRYAAGLEIDLHELPENSQVAIANRRPPRFHVSTPYTRADRLNRAIVFASGIELPAPLGHTTANRPSGVKYRLYGP